jgi:hypothetical protein
MPIDKSRIYKRGDFLTMDAPGKAYLQHQRVAERKIEREFPHMAETAATANRDKKISSFEAQAANLKALAARFAEVKAAIDQHNAARKRNRK